MTDHLTIHCAQNPDDTIDANVDDIGAWVWLTTFMLDEREAPCVALNRQSAQELYDLLGEFLADDQR